MASLDRRAIGAAATLLWRNWIAFTRIPTLPADCRPVDRADGYAIQTELASLAGQRTVGWKIAATSQAGQSHLAVDGPLAGRLLDGRVLSHGHGQHGIHGEGIGTVSLAENAMRLAEAEFAFRLGRDLPRRDHPYALEEVMEAVDTIQPAIELPDSRFEDVARVGAPQLIADVACASWLVVGPPARVDWRGLDLSAHEVVARRDGVVAERGIGAKVMGDPRLALTWLANELRAYGEGLRVDDIVTTGTCITPVSVAPGDLFSVDFGSLGSIEIRLT
jgi:2-keto-4-pentenoate hydratase